MKCALKLAFALALLIAVTAVQAQTSVSSSKQKTDLVKFSPEGLYLPQAQPTAARTLNFPTDKSYGGVIILDAPLFVFHNTAGAKGSSTCKAQGMLRVPANKFVVFAPNGNFIMAPHSLDHLPANAFDGVVFRFMSMEDSDTGKGDPALAALNHFTSIRSLDLEKAEVSDKGLNQLKDLKNLEFITLFSTETRGEFIKELTGCKRLRSLKLSHDAIDMSYLQYLAQYPQLCQLSLRRTKLTAQAAKPLMHCHNLQYLDISDNPQVDDGVIPVLLSLRKLQFLRTERTAISRSGLRSLFTAGVKPQGTDLLAPVSDSGPKSGVSAAAQKQRSEMETIFAPMSRGRGL